MAKTGRNTISVDQHLNTCWNLKFQPGQNPNSHLKFLFQFKLRLYLKYNLKFKYEIKLEVLSLFTAEHRARMQKFPNSDRFCKIHRSSLNTQPIRIILSAFERREHSEDNPRFKNAKILFFGLGRTYKVYFRGWICLNHALHDSGTYGALWVGSNICKPCI